MYVGGVGCVSTLGCGVPQTAAAVRSGLGAFRRGPYRDARGRPFSTARVPDRELDRLGVAVDERRSWWPRARALAIAAMQEASDARDDEPLPLLVALADVADAPPRDRALAELVAGSGVRIDRAASSVHAGGAAAFFVALARAYALLRGGTKAVLVGAADSCIADARLAHLDDDRGVARIGGRGSLVPGEGAAFVRLVAAGASVSIDAIGHDAGATDIDAEPSASAEALAVAMRGVGAEPFASVWAGLDGDVRTSKPWGVALVRNPDVLPSRARLEHPIDCLGDAGTAMGAILLALGQHALRERARESPALVWAASIDGSCGCARLSTRAEGARR